MSRLINSEPENFKPLSFLADNGVRFAGPGVRMDPMRMGSRLYQQNGTGFYYSSAGNWQAHLSPESIFRTQRILLDRVGSVVVADSKEEMITFLENFCKQIRLDEHPRYLNEHIENVPLDLTHEEPVNSPYCQLTGVAYSNVLPRNVYGRSIRTTPEELYKRGLVWVVDVSSYLSIFDPNIQLISVSGGFYTRKYVTSPEAPSAVTTQGGDLHWYSECIQLYNGDFITVEEFSSEDYFRCANCDQVYPEHMRCTYDPDICDSCAGEREESIEDVLHEYSFDPVGDVGFLYGMNPEGGELKYKKLDALSIKQQLKRSARAGDGDAKRALHNPFYGFEIEVQVWNEDYKEARVCIEELNARGFAFACKDATVEYGCEFKSPPVAEHIVPRYLTELYKHVNHNNFDADDACGLHIHISRSALTEMQVGRICAFMHHHVNRPFLETVAGRGRDNYYARFDYSQSQNIYIERELDFTTERPSTKPTFKNKERYSGLNLLKGHTIEFRMFQGAVHLQEWLSAFEFCKALVRFTRPWVSGNSEMKASNFIKWLLKSGVYKEYPNLTKRIEQEDYIKTTTRNYNGQSFKKIIKQ